MTKAERQTDKIC